MRESRSGAAMLMGVDKIELETSKGKSKERFLMFQQLEELSKSWAIVIDSSWAVSGPAMSFRIVPSELQQSYQNRASFCDPILLRPLLNADFDSSGIRMKCCNV